MGEAIGRPAFERTEIAGTGMHHDKTRRAPNPQFLQRTGGEVLILLGYAQFRDRGRGGDFVAGSPGKAVGLVDAVYDRCRRSDPLAGKPVAQFLARAPGEAKLPPASAQPQVNTTFEISLKIEHEVITSRSELADMAEKSLHRGDDVAGMPTFLQGSAGIDHPPVDGREQVEDRCAAIFDEPIEFCIRVLADQRPDRRHREQDVPDRTQADDENLTNRRHCRYPSSGLLSSTWSA